MLAKVLAWGTGIAILGFGVKKVVDLKKKSSAANDLKVGFSKLVFKKASISQGILFDVVLKATNNSTAELNFTQPFVELSILNAANQLQPIAASNDAGGVVSLKPRTTSDLTFNLSISPINSLKVPGLLIYIVGRMANKQKPSSKKVLVEYGFTAEGIDFKQKQDVVI